MRKYLVTSVVLSVLATVSLVAAQMGTGRVTGTVKDAEGNPIEGAVVTATPEGSESERVLETKTGSDGKWAMLGFRTGNYAFKFEAEGFRPQAYTQRVKQTGRNPVMDVVLEPLQMGQSGGAMGGLLNEANQLFDQKQYAEAIAKYEEILAAEPTVYQVNFNIGSSYREMGELDEAISYFEKVLAEEPMHMASLVSIGDIMVEKGDLEAAVSYFEKAIDQTEDEVVPFNVGEIYFNQGNAQGAIEYYQLAAERRPDWPEPYLKIGYASLNTGDMEGAKAAFQKVVEVAPGSPQAQMAEAALSSLQ